MWPFKLRKPEIISATISPQQLMLSWIRENKRSRTIEIKSYKNCFFKNLEFEKSIVFNPTKINFLVKNFAQENNIKKAKLAISIDGSSIFEKIIRVSTATPTAEDFQFKELKDLKWNYTYLGPSTKHGFEFYICGIKREILFQYKLIGIKSNINPIVITSTKNAHIELYKYLKGINFRQGQLLLDLKNNNYDIQNTFTSAIISKHFVLDPNLKSETKKNSQLSTNIGLFLLGNKT